MIIIENKIKMNIEQKKQKSIKIALLEIFRNVRGSRVISFSDSDTGNSPRIAFVH